MRIWGGTACASALFVGIVGCKRRGRRTGPSLHVRRGGAVRVRRVTSGPDIVQRDHFRREVPRLSALPPARASHKNRPKSALNWNSGIRVERVAWLETSGRTSAHLTRTQAGFKQTQMKLPNGGEAIVDSAKLRDYCLSPEHEEGKHKARVFAAALGIFRNDAAWLRERLIEAAGRENAILVSETVFWPSFRARLRGKDTRWRSPNSQRLG